MNLKNLIVTVCLLVCSFTTSSKVQIQYAGNQINYDINPRLSAVLNRLVVTQDFYWHTASLYRLNDSSSSADVLAVNKLLDRTISQTGVKTQKMTALLALKQQLNSWNIAKRLPLVIDYDLIRIRDELNPKLENGDYYLHLPFRVYEVNVVGAVNEPVKLAHLATEDVSAYLDDDIGYLPYADKSRVYIIHPDGSVTKVDVGLHNNMHNEVPPGGTLFIPIKELPFSSLNTEINERLAQLAGSRLP